MPNEGEVVEGTVAKIMDYGAFIDLDDGASGLVHISQISHSFVRDVNEHLHEGDRITVQVVGSKPDGRLDLSMKALEPDPREKRPRRGRDPEFEKMLRKFMQRSNERQAEVKRNLRQKLN